MTVFGQIALSRCDTPGALAVAGFVLGTGRPPEKVAVVFKAMPPGDLAFLCAKSPVSQWSGADRRDRRRSYRNGQLLRNFSCMLHGQSGLFLSFVFTGAFANPV